MGIRGLGVSGLGPKGTEGNGQEALTMGLGRTAQHSSLGFLNRSMYALILPKRKYPIRNMKAPRFHRGIDIASVSSSHIGTFLLATITA